MELEKRYSSKNTETRLYDDWEKRDCFKPKSDKDPKGNKDPYTIVIPPPNVTGILHMGHALNNTIQDILIRWNRMKGMNTLWVPGVDHAGIATQNVVEKKLAKQKKKRWDLGRENFLKEVWKWKEENGSTITRQLRRLGSSCDWSRERFTMDEGLSDAVREAFITLYDKGLIYRGNYIINWGPRCGTALSDEEAAHKDVEGGLYHIKYPIAGMGRKLGKMGEDHIAVATTRPETMLGDTGVAINPKDPRYKNLIGKKVILPLMEREIPIIEDDFVDPDFGTGIVKVTPAHDPNDFQMGLRHNLPQINILTPNGKISKDGGKYEGLDRFEARKKVIADLEAEGFFIRRDSHLHAVGHCYRCDTVVEPYLSKQWFVKMKPMAEKALKAHKKGETKFYPDRWTKVYTNWLEGIKDWCISRQIWWGHQIPVWYCRACAKTADHKPQVTEKKQQSEVCSLKSDGVIVSKETPKICPKCGGSDLVQDSDVLDTWFSSWLWPFSTLGWPKKTDDLKNFYPTSDLITAPEIIFFWVARMIMAGLEFMGEVPFSRIYIHGTVRAEGGLKMSKSLGNSINPLEVIDEMGADALRYSLVMLSAQDVFLSREKFEVGRNFTNKVWNACRFALMQLKDFTDGSTDPDQFCLSELSIRDRWILSTLEKKTEKTEKHLSSFGLSQASTDLYHFVWNDFCDWFIELSKSSLQSSDEKTKLNTQKVLFFVLERILRLLHPFMPFVTDEIWQTFKGKALDKDKWADTLMTAKWPLEGKKFYDKDAERSIDILQKTVGGIRDLRARFNIGPAKLLKAVISCKEKGVDKTLELFKKEIMALGRLEDMIITASFKKDDGMVGNAFSELDVFISTEGLIDPKKEKERLTKKIEETEKWAASIKKKLENESFVKRAPSEIVQKEKEKIEDAKKLLISYKDQLSSIK